MTEQEAIEEAQRQYVDAVSGRFSAETAAHVPRLYELSKGLTHITEAGVRECCTTWGFFCAQPEKLVMIDINRHPRMEIVTECGEALGMEIEFRQADTTKIEIEETDLLFIDTDHRYAIATEELRLHADKVRKYIVFHDTFGKYAHWEDWPYDDESRGQYRGDKDKYGMRAAVRDFLAAHPEWQILVEYPDSNGLTVLERI